MPVDQTIPTHPLELCQKGSIFDTSHALMSFDTSVRPPVSKVAIPINSMIPVAGSGAAVEVAVNGELVPKLVFQSAKSSALRESDDSPCCHARKSAPLTAPSTAPSTTKSPASITSRGSKAFHLPKHYLLRSRDPSLALQFLLYLSS
jgi:hypothetical protein